MKVRGVVVCIDGFLFMIHTIIYRLHVHIQNFYFLFIYILFKHDNQETADIFDRDIDVDPNRE